MTKNEKRLQEINVKIAELEGRLGKLLNQTPFEGWDIKNAIEDLYEEKESIERYNGF